MSRRILVFAHTGREESLKAAREACLELTSSGLIAVMNPVERQDMEDYFGDRDTPTEGCGRTRYCGPRAPAVGATEVQRPPWTITGGGLRTSQVDIISLRRR